MPAEAAEAEAVAEVLAETVEAAEAAEAAAAAAASAAVAAKGTAAGSSIGGGSPPPPPRPPPYARRGFTHRASWLLSVSGGGVATCGVRHSAALQCVRVCQQSQHHTAVEQCHS